MEDAIDLVYFSRFSGLSHLNTDPLLKIRNMTTAVTFMYSVEINNMVQSQLYQALEITEVQPLVCRSDLKNFKLLCFWGRVFVEEG